MMPKQRFALSLFSLTCLLPLSSSHLCSFWRSSLGKPVAHLYHDFDESEKDALPSGFIMGICQRNAVVIVHNCRDPEPLQLWDLCSAQLVGAISSIPVTLAIA